MLDNLSVQKRILIATLLAFIFFIAYDYFYLSKLRPVSEANATVATTAQYEAPAAKTQAPISKPTSNATNSLLNVYLKDANLTIDSYGRISSYILNDSKFVDEDGKQINLIKQDSYPYPLEIRFENAELNSKAFATAYTTSSSDIDATKSEASVVLTQDLGEVIVNKKLTFYPNSSYKVEVNLSKNSPFYISPGSRPSVVVDGYTVHGALVRKSNESLEIFEDGDVKGLEQVNSANITAVSDRYYTALFYNFENNLNVVVSDNNKISEIFIKADKAFNAGGFIGPKSHDMLTQIDQRLENVIEYGWFTFLAKPMFKFLNWLYAYIGNWGWAIVILTLVIRLILFPLSYKGMMSMNRLKDLAPRMKELQDKYKGDPQKLQAHMMEFYKKNKVNPMGGCLPILLQIPVFFAIYRVLLNAIELKGAEWILWVDDLASKDPYFILPITMGILMFVQQKITPTNFTDPMQEKIMKYLPLIFTFFFLTFPAGLTLYWTINNICSIIQQYVINKMFAKHKAQEIAEKHK